MIGDECHIISPKPAGPRNDPAFLRSRLDSYENLILLCKNHHKEIDDQEQRYPASALLELKRKHEDYIHAATEPLRPRDYENAAFPDTPAGEVVEKKVGVPWSDRADIMAEVEVVRFMGRLIAKARREDANGPTWYELYRLQNGRFLVYTQHVHRFDYCVTTLHGGGAWGEADPPLTIEDVQEIFPFLASRAGFPRIRNIPT